MYLYLNVDQYFGFKKSITRHTCQNRSLPFYIALFARLRKKVDRRDTSGCHVITTSPLNRKSPGILCPYRRFFVNLNKVSTSWNVLSFTSKGSVSLWYRVTRLDLALCTFRVLSSCNMISFLIHMQLLPNKGKRENDCEQWTAIFIQ